MPRAMHRRNSRETPNSAESTSDMAPSDVAAEVARRLRENPDWVDTEFWAETACPSGYLPNDLSEWNAANKAGVAAHAAHAAGWDVFFRQKYPLDLFSVEGRWLAERPASSRVTHVSVAGQEALGLGRHPQIAKWLFGANTPESERMAVLDELARGASPRRAMRRAVKHLPRTLRTHEPDLVVTVTITQLF